jgi:hypothetical protein
MEIISSPKKVKTVGNSISMNSWILLYKGSNYADVPYIEYVISFLKNVEVQQPVIFSK